MLWKAFALAKMHEAHNNRNKSTGGRLVNKEPLIKTMPAAKGLPIVCKTLMVEE